MKGSLGNHRGVGFFTALNVVIRAVNIQHTLQQGFSVQLHVVSPLSDSGFLSEYPQTVMNILALSTNFSRVLFTETFKFMHKRNYEHFVNNRQTVQNRLIVKQLL
jgi:hypothetical protein